MRPLWSSGTKKGAVRATHLLAHQYNHRINELKTSLEKRLIDLISIVESPTIEQLKEKLFEPTMPKHAIGFLEFGQQLVMRYIEARRIGSANSYECSIRKVLAFKNNKDFPLREIDYHFLMRFESFCYSTGLKVNALGIYLRQLRSILNQAQKAGYLEKPQYAFEHYYIKKESSAKRAISKDDLSKLLNISLDIRPGLQDSLNYFTFMFHTRGMNFAGLIALKCENIHQGRLVYRRMKTGK